jgi:ribosomal protein S18 acetylase RimI-like enzyme
VSTLTIEINETTATLWDVCNDLNVKGGYMRLLMDASLDYIRTHKKWGVKTVQLYVLLSNPYYEKAVALYKSRGFKVDTQFVSEYGDRIRMIYRFL